MSDRSLIVLPDESSKPILDAIIAAKKSLQVKMFVFSDPDLLRAVIAAHQRGVKVRVMLNAARRSGEDDNETVRKALEHAGIEPKDSNPEFGITHEKSMVVDEEIAFVKSLNWVTKNLTETRDYAITTTHPHEVKEVIECFDADWHRKEFKPGLSAHLIWCPVNGRERIAQFIDEVKHTLFVQNERYQDQVIIERLVRARERGVKVRVMLNAARRDGDDDNKDVRKALEHAGIDVKDSNPAFGITHEKSMVVDEEIAFVKSLNWATKNLTETRDYAISTTHPHGVKEIIACFDADWHRKEFKPGLSAHLIWCPANGRERIANFIDGVKHTLFVQNERYQDSVIIERLVRARERGVKIHLMARPPHSLKKEKIVEGVGGLRIMDDVGIKIHKLKHLKLHGKMLLADGLRAIVGSINLAPGSFDDRRELAIEVDDDDLVERLAKVAKHDWENSHPLDLTDEGLFEDLEEHGGAEKLVLRMDHEYAKKHKK